MSQFDDMRKKTMRWRVGWQRAALRLRRFFGSVGQWATQNVPWRKLAYFSAGMLVIIAFWGLTGNRDAILRQLRIPAKNEGRSNAAAGAEVTALSRLENEVSTLKARLKQMSDPEKTLTDSSFNPSQFSRPALGVCGQTMGWIRVGDEWRFHDGVDLAVPPGTNVLAAAEGVVKFVSSQPSMGTIVAVDHGNGWESRYGHLQGILVTPGQKVERGTVLGQSSALNCQDAPGFHFSIYLKGEPVDPAGVIPGLGE